MQASRSTPIRFCRRTPIGAYRGFPVYRDTRGNAEEIFVTAVKDGPLVPYRR